MKVVFNPNIPIFPPNSAEGLHFSAFHYYCTNLLLLFIYLFVIIIIIIISDFYILLSLDIFHSLIIIFLCFSISRYIHLLLY